MKGQDKNRWQLRGVQMRNFQTQFGNDYHPHHPVLNAQGRVVIESITPQIDCGRFPVKRVAGEELTVQADVFCDGHDEVAALLLFRSHQDEHWQERLMQRLGEDRWQASVPLPSPGTYHYTVAGWVNYFRTWQKALHKKHQAGQDVAVELSIGVERLRQAARFAASENAIRLDLLAEALEEEKDLTRAVALALDPKLADFIDEHADRPFLTRYTEEFSVTVDRKKALFSSWYEVFPRSCASQPGKHGSLQDVERLLPEIAQMGFDVLYLPPIHPIGTSKRKGRNNATQAQPSDPGSPWAIGSHEGGHKAVHPELGTLDDFRSLVQKGSDLGIELALDLAFQCSPDHPYLTEHPDWFHWRPDGSVQHAENPPKKYEDIIPFYFETPSWRELWEELRSVVFFWIEQGVRIFRVDNPHTKAFPFWEWLIGEVKTVCPEAIFLAEAFTRPKVMYRLAKLGFDQSYSYFTWRNSKQELTDYLSELLQTEVCQHLRPNFWPNTPDILPEPLQYGGRPAFMIRLALAATLSSSYGIYGPVYELCVGDAIPGTEEYRHAEKYEIKEWDRNAPGNLKGFIAALNRVRRENEALQANSNLRFYHCDNENIIFFGKSSVKSGNIVLVAVNLDPFHPQTGMLQIPVAEFGIKSGHPYPVHDLLTGERFIWQGEFNRITLDPLAAPARIFRTRSRLHKEVDFDYYL